jgi:hypothetical protein
MKELLDMTDVTVQHLTERVRVEYLEMPGLSLTVPQAGRLCNVDPDASRQLLDGLVAQNFLMETKAGRYVRK